MEEKLNKIIREYKECDSHKNLCIGCSAYEHIPLMKTTWCEFLMEHGRNVIEAITDCMEKIL